MWAVYAATFEGAAIKVCKTKGHATSTHFETGESTWWQKRGNDDADRFAKEGARLHEIPPAALAEHLAFQRVGSELAVFGRERRPRQQTRRKPTWTWKPSLR